MTQPLAGLKVLEVAQFAAGPFPALLLADFGADVVKIEPPGGDGFRNWPPQVDSGGGEPYGISFAVLNRNKRSVVLDLKNAGDRARFLSLCAKAEVLVENNRPGAMERLGLGFADRKSTRLNSSHITISYAVFCLKKKKKIELNICSYITAFYIKLQYHVQPSLPQHLPPHHPPPPNPRLLPPPLAACSFHLSHSLL